MERVRRVVRRGRKRESNVIIFKFKRIQIVNV